ncbi:MAG TPA: SRPBCC family protein [Solirubrobacterales bacterium]|nr:SRPBCC family protein [Solirubrobacterales bacterium]
MGELQATRTVEIDAPPERCYEIAADLERTPDWQDSMVSIEVLERDSEGRPEVVEIVSDAKIRQVKNRMRFSYDPPDGLSWEQEKGELKWLKGSWTFEPHGDGGTRAVYSLRADPGRMLGLLLRGPVEGKVKEFLTKDSTDGLKRAAESA